MKHEPSTVGTWFLRAVMGLCLVASACGSDDAAQLLETAQFEERQNNQTHAKELYEDIIRRYPSSPAADQARARLAQLKPAP